MLLKAFVVVAVLLGGGMAAAPDASARAVIEGDTVRIYADRVEQRQSCDIGIEARHVDIVYTVTINETVHFVFEPEPTVGPWQVVRPLSPAEAHGLRCGLPARIAKLQARKAALTRQVRRLHALLADRRP